MQDRKTALTAFAHGKSGHSFGLDDLCDDVIHAEMTGHLPRGRGLDAEDRQFIELLYHYSSECRVARAKAGIGI